MSESGKRGWVIQGGNEGWREGGSGGEGGREGGREGWGRRGSRDIIAGQEGQCGRKRKEGGRQVRENME